MNIDFPSLPSHALESGSVLPATGQTLTLQLAVATRQGSRNAMGGIVRFGAGRTSSSVTGQRAAVLPADESALTLTF